MIVWLRMITLDIAKIWSNSGYILKVELIFVDELNVHRKERTMSRIT